jgi:hypothetical protein
MDSFIFIVIIMVVLTLLERLMKAGRAGKPPGAPPDGPDREEQGERHERIPRDLQELIAEQLGIKVERPPAEEKPVGITTERHELESSPAAPQARRRVGPRSEAPNHRAERHMPQATVSRQAPSTTTPIGRTRTVVYPSTPAARPRPIPRPVEVTPAGAVISLEEQAAMERGEPVSLERPRTPEQHERFHDLYVDRGDPISTGRRPRPILPDRAGWTAVHRAVVWSEILGPPRGLVE